MSAEFPSVSEAISQEQIDRYAEVSGDYNPIHVDQEAAAASEFGGTIAHGPIALQTFFRSLTELSGGQAPPPGTAVKVTFRAPVRPGDTVHSELREREDNDGTTAIAVECVNQDGTTVIAAQANIPD